MALNMPHTHTHTLLHTWPSAIEMNSSTTSVTISPGAASALISSSNCFCSTTCRPHSIIMMSDLASNLPSGILAWGPYPSHTFIRAFCSSLSVWYLLMSTTLLMPVAHLPETRGISVMDPPPAVRFSLAGRMNSVEKNLGKRGV